MSLNKAQSALGLRDWALESVNARMRSSNFQSGSRFALDPRISHERRIQLIKAFDEIDVDKSGKLSYEEIFNYLKDINEEVSEEYVKTIFESMDANKDGQVSIEEFINTYLNQVDGLSEAVARFRQKILEKRRDLESTNNQLEEAMKSERINSWGIMEGSLLTVRVVEAQNLVSFSGKPSAYVNLLCERQQIATNIIKNERNPNWDESFSFKISSGNGEILIQVFNEGTISKDDLLGTSSVSLKEFEDQEKHEKWFHLQGSSNTARILLSIQWIHRKTEYLKKIRDNLVKEIDSDTIEMENIENEMRKLGTNPLGMFKKETWVDKLEGKIISEVQEISDEHFQALGSIDQVQKMMLGIFTILAVLTSFARPDLANLSWAGASWSREISGWTMQNYRYAGLSLVVLVLYDFFWVFANFEYMVFDVHQDPLVNLHRFSFVMGFFNFVLKILIFIVMAKSYILIKAQETSSLLGS
ncbi:hypothetical protein SteCoe_2527 [Stentor coeruleus]|uniref:C2 domain-containing protein n=1 Tax=Stentor coeruleus TaxID=5963 RepID=A0A1R2CZ90_9CILI|nr:hypothetical protein SteCoe_2527 [Stentor coeruleus]